MHAYIHTNIHRYIHRHTDEMITAPFRVEYVIHTHTNIHIYSHCLAPVGLEHVFSYILHDLILSMSMPVSVYIAQTTYIRTYIHTYMHTPMMVAPVGLEHVVLAYVLHDLTLFSSNHTKHPLPVVVRSLPNIHMHVCYVCVVYVCVWVCVYIYTHTHMYSQYSATYTHA
jgi:hypothetical protein